MKHLTILNKNAGGYSAREKDKISAALAGESGKLEGKILATPDLETLKYQLHRHKEYHPDILGIGGGDGTASQTLTLVDQIFGSIPPYVAAYAMGTMNNWAIPFGLSDGLVDKLKVKTGVGDTKAVQLARSLRKAVEEEKPFSTGELLLLDANGRKGFNLGFGFLPKLVWLYYGKTMEQYGRLEEELNQSSTVDYKEVFEGIFAEQPNSGIIDVVAKSEILRKVGGLHVAKTAFDVFKNVLGNSEHNFFSQEMPTVCYLDGKKLSLPAPPTGIYIASYEQQNLGSVNFSATPSPEARQVPGKMQVVITYGRPTEIISQLPAVFLGKHLKKTYYAHVSELRLESEQVLVGEVDADFIYGKNIIVRPSQSVNFISLKD